MELPPPRPLPLSAGPRRLVLRRQGCELGKQADVGGGTVPLLTASGKEAAGLSASSTHAPSMLLAAIVRAQQPPGHALLTA